MIKLHISKLILIRRIEMFVAGLAFFFGVWLLAPMISMRTPAFLGLLNLMSEYQWGAIFLLNGLNHGLALAINGSRWWSPLVRWVASFSTMSLGLLWAGGFYYVDPASTGVFMYFWSFAVGGGVCAIVAWSDSIKAVRMEAARAVLYYR